MTTGPLLDSALAEAGWLRRLARSLVKDAHRADDAVQATLASALEQRKEQRPPRAWLAAILRNELRQERRARGRRAFHERRALRMGSAPSAHDVNERLELQRLLLEALRALEEPYRSTLVARFFDGLPPRAIARRDGVPVKTVNTHLERGLAKLRQRLDGKFGGERGAWLQAFLPLAAPAGVPWSFLREGLSMGAKAKVAAAVVAAGIGIFWVAELARTPGSLAPESRSARPASPVLTQRGGSASLLEPELGASTRASAELVAVESVARESRSEAVDSALAPAPAVNSRAHLSVRAVTRRTREPLGGLAVTVARPEGAKASALFEDEPVAVGATDGSGGLRLVVPAGWPLWVSVDPGRWHERPGGDPELRPELLQRTSVPVEPLLPGEERVLLVEIEHGSDRVLEGQVVAAEDGRALAGARIAPEDTFGEPLAADAHGFFALPYSSWDPPPAVEIAHEGYTPVSLRPQWVDQVPGVPLVVVLERGAVIEAHIDAAGHTGLELHARAAREAGGAIDSSARLGPSGLGELLVPARLALALELRTQDGELLWRDPEPWTLVPGERRELTLRLGSGSFVYGSLLDQAGFPIPDQELWAVPAVADEELEGELRYLEDEREDALVAHTGRDGHFEFPELVSGTWWIGPAPRSDEEREREDDAVLAPAGQRVELLPGSASRRVDLVGHRGLWIRGRVEGEDGRALAGVQVGCGRGRNDAELQAFSDDQGRFRIGPLFPATYELRTFGGDGVFGWPSEATTVEAGASDVVLVLPLRNSIGGRVVDGEGRAVDAHVHLLRLNSSLGQGTSQREQGAFLFIALEADIYSAQAEAPDGRVAVRRVGLAEGASVAGVVLTLGEGTRIGVRHDLDRYVRCAIWAGDALAADSTVPRGEESFETVPAGPLRIELYSGDEIVAVRELIGRAGRVESVEFDLEPGD